MKSLSSWVRGRRMQTCVPSLVRRERMRLLVIESLEDRSLLDSTGPRVLSLTPTEARNVEYAHVDVTFNEAIDFSTVSAADFQIKTPSGAFLAIDSVISTSAITARAQFAPQIERGTYQINVGPAITDVDGNLMDQNQNATNGEVELDIFKGKVIAIRADTIITAATTIEVNNLTYENKDIAVDGAIVTIDGLHRFNSIHLVNGAKLTHSANSENAVFAVNLIVEQQTILDADTSIDVTGKGLDIGNSFAGGSYGGAGQGASVSSVFGDYADPDEPGRGARSSGSGFSTIVSGGGLVRLTTGTLILDGSIVAAGAIDSFGPSGGSGGGIFVSTDTLKGGGSISAPGGADSNPGGGGRVALYYREIVGFDLDRVTARGGGGSAGAGTVYLRSKNESRGTLVVAGGSGPTALGVAGQASYSLVDDVIVRNANVRPHHANMSLEFLGTLNVAGGIFSEVDGTVVAKNSASFKSGSSLDVTMSGTFSVEGELLVEQSTISGGKIAATKMTIANASTLTHLANDASPDFKLEIIVTGQLSIDQTSSIDVTGKGLNVGNSFAGGSYGGAGQGASVSSVFGDYADPDEPGRGARSSGSGFSTIVSGGGLVRLTTGTLILDGSIVAAGAIDSFGPSGGSGGGIFVSTDTLKGGGSISAPGGADSNPGGGGRVALYYREIVGFDLDRVTARGGGGSAGAGTVYLRSKNESRGTLVVAGGSGPTALGVAGQASYSLVDDVIVRNANVRPHHANMSLEFLGTLNVAGGIFSEVDGTVVAKNSASFKSGSSLDVTMSGTFSVEGELLVEQSTISGGKIAATKMTIANASTLTHLANDASPDFKLEIIVTGQLSIDQTSSIDVTGKGLNVGNSFAGGSYGGAGQGASVSSVFGDYADPDEPGRGARSSGPGFSTIVSGGGLVRLTTGTLILDGSIVAAGAIDSFGPFGGSGGGIFVSTDTLKGGGSISAPGGADSIPGGGGRVALYYREIVGFDLDHVTAQSGGGSAGAGTVHIVGGFPYTHLRSVSPQGINGGRVTDLTNLTLRFNKEINTSSFSSILVNGPQGRLQASKLTLIGDRAYRIDFPVALSDNGYYHFTLLPEFRDADGNKLDQNTNGVPGEETDSVGFTYILDRIAPRTTGHSPAGDQAGTINSIDIFLSEAIDKNTLGTDDVSISRPDGSGLSASEIAEVGLNRFRVSFPSQTLVGSYHFRIGPDFRDLAGNPLDQDRDGVFGEANDDVYTATVNLVQVDLGLNGLTLGSTHLVAGIPLTLSWQGRNLTGTALVGNWIDAVYLSKNNTWDASDILLTTVPHSGGLAAGQEYTGSTTVNIPGVFAGDYHIVVRADVANQERETDEVNNQIASSRIALLVTTLATNTPMTGALSASDRVDYFAVSLAGGDVVRFQLDSAANSRVEMMVGYATIPTRSFFDHRSATPGTHQEFTLTAINGGGTYYVMVYGDQVASSTSYHV